MALDPTARKANVKDSWKKYLVDNLSYAVSFDTGVTSPRLQGRNLDVDRWISVSFGPTVMDDLSDATILIFCCTRRDPEGYKLAQVRDTVMGLLSDTTQTDTMARVPFYRSYESQEWELLGAMLVQEVLEDQERDAPDETKFVMLTVRVRWGAKV